jgi:hypothetical protein
MHGGGYQEYAAIDCSGEEHEMADDLPVISLSALSQFGVSSFSSSSPASASISRPRSLQPSGGDRRRGGSRLSIGLHDDGVVDDAVSRADSEADEAVLNLDATIDQSSCGCPPGVMNEPTVRVCVCLGLSVYLSVCRSVGLDAVDLSVVCS